jgi:uncharacterized membrane protein YgcG
LFALLVAAASASDDNVIPFGQRVCRLCPFFFFFFFFFFFLIVVFFFFFFFFSIFQVDPFAAGKTGLQATTCQFQVGDHFVGTLTILDSQAKEKKIHTFFFFFFFFFFTGKYGVSARAAAQTGRDVSLVIGADNFAMFLSAGVSVFSRFVQVDDFVTIVDLASVPNTVACGSNHVAKYVYDWADDCSSVKLHGRFDECAARGGLLRGAVSGAPIVFTRAPCAKSQGCDSVAVGSTFAGKYADGGKFQVTLGASGIIEAGDHGVYFFGQGQVPNNASVIVATQAGAQYGDDCVGNATSKVLASMKNEKDVCHLHTQIVSDDCEVRAKRIGGAKASLVVAPNCGPKPRPATTKKPHATPEPTRRKLAQHGKWAYSPSGIFAEKPSSSSSSSWHSSSGSSSSSSSSRSSSSSDSSSDSSSSSSDSSSSSS